MGRSMATVETPRVVAALDSMYVTHVAAGALTSACIVDGKLYEVSCTPGWCVFKLYCNRRCCCFGVVEPDSRNVFPAQWGFCCTALKAKDKDEDQTDSDEVSYEDAMESMVQLTGLVRKVSVL